jgi:nitrate reductase gamma subunit
MEIGTPTVLITGVVLVVAVGYLYLRRVASPQLRYISLVADYFPLFLILFIGLTGIGVRYFFRTDVAGVKQLMLSLVSFQPSVPDGLHPVLYAHLLLVCVLLAYFPFSKLMHAGGVFLSPTRNLANDNRRRRHVNPWAEPAKVYPYEKYEDEFRTKMKEVGIPVERDLAAEEK